MQVYGGISIAACAGKFIRDNEDVDIFVRYVDFEKAKSILDSLCYQKNFELKYHPPKSNDKPKIDIKIDNEKRFSMVPVYQENNNIVFKYPKNNEIYPNQNIEIAERTISGYRFFTSQDKFIKMMFIKHIELTQIHDLPLKIAEIG